MRLEHLIFDFVKYSLTRVLPAVYSGLLAVSAATAVVLFNFQCINEKMDWSQIFHGSGTGPLKNEPALPDTHHVLIELKMQFQ